MSLHSLVEEMLGVEFSQATFVDLLRSRALAHGFRPSYTFLQDGETETDRATFAELDRRARDFAATLQQTIQPGARVLLFFPPGLDYIAAFFGCLYAGAIAVPAYPPRSTLTPRGLSRLKAIAEDCSPAAVLLDSRTKDAAPPIVAQIPALETIAWLSPLDCSPDKATQWRPPSLNRSTPAFLQYTSGSTGSPKGVIITHENLLQNQELMADAFEHDESTMIVGWLPMFHDMGLVGNVLHPVYLGVHCVLMPPVAFLEKPARWLQAISRYRATTSGGPNFAYDYCVKKISSEERTHLDLSSWSVAFNGSEPVQPQTLDYFAKTFQACGFRREALYPCYGLAEATLMVSGGRKSDPPVVRRFLRDALALGTAVPHNPELTLAGAELTGCGQLLGEQCVAIVDPATGCICPEGQVGEIWISGPIVGAGYWNHPEVTDAVFGAVLAEFPTRRFLRTGDLGFEHRGELFIAGRLKDQIIVRGRNYHPHDLEFVAALSHPALRANCCAAFSMTIDSQEQVVMVLEVSRPPAADAGSEIVAAIRQAIAEEFELQVHTVILIRKATIPKTSSGKIQRHACKTRFVNDSLDVLWRNSLSGESAGTGEAAKDARSDLDAFLELPVPEQQKAIFEYLRSGVAEILGLSAATLDPERPLGSFGMDSLKAVELQHRIEEDFSVAVELAEILSYPPIEELAALVVSRLAARDLDKPSEPMHFTEGAHPLTHGQRALYFLALLNPTSSAYHIARAVHVLESVDARALLEALYTLSARHAALRTTFAEKDGEPVQIVHHLLHPEFIEADLSAQTEEEVLRRLQVERDRPFNLEYGPLMRVGLFKTTAGSVLMLTVHHIVADLWSLTIVCEELTHRYRAAKSGAISQLPPQPGSYADYARQQRDMLGGPEGTKLWSYWKELLREEPPGLALPSDRPRPGVQTNRGAAFSFHLGQDTVAEIKKNCARVNAGLYVGMVSLFQAFLCRYTGEEGLFTGSPFFGRNKSDFAATVGYFVNPLPLRASLSVERSLRDWLVATRRTVLDAIAHGEYPFPLMVDQAGLKRDPNRSPVFQSMVVMQQLPHGMEHLGPIVANEGGHVVDLGGLQVRSLKLPATAAQFDLSLLLSSQPDGSLACAFEYNSDLFESETAARMARHFSRLIDSMLQHPEAPVGAAALLTQEEIEQVTVGWNSTARSYPAGLLHELFEIQARKTPERIAVELGKESLTFVELDHFANGLALFLRGHGVATDQVVGVFMDRSLEMVVSLVATLKAGAAYLPLDPSYPPERLAYMARDSRLCVLLTASPEPLPFNLDGVPVLNVAEKFAELRGQHFTPPPGLNSGDSLAYVIYTSGSTGKPKGVMIPHSGIVSRLLWMNEAYGLQPSDKVLHKTPLSFDVSVWEVFWPLLMGARLVLAPPAAQKDPERLAHLIQHHGITVMHFVPSMLGAFLETPGVDQTCGSLRLVVCSGEALTVDLRTRFLQRIPASLQNLYGPTEASVDVTYWDCGEESAHLVPIGRPIANTQIYVLDPNLHPVAVGVPGQLFIAGKGLARGYRDSPQLAAESFLPNPFAATSGERMYCTGDLARWRKDGALEFLGRIDDQIKINGNRVELGELESVLGQHPGVQQAAAALAGNRLIGYVVPRPSQEHALGDLRSYLGQRLPSFMVPTSFVTLERLPVTKSGKVDRKSLPLPDSGETGSKAPYVPPYLPEQELLVEIWAEVLKLNRVGIQDNFFELGGDSILSIRVVSLAQKRGLALTLDQLYERQTVEELCPGLIGNIPGRPSLERMRPFALLSEEDRHLVGEGLEDAYPMSFLQQGLLFHSDRGTDYETYVTTLRLRTAFDGARLQQALGMVIERHPILRTTFDTAEFSQPMQLVHPSAPAVVHIHDLRGLPPESREAAFFAWIETEKRAKFDWACCPLIRIHAHPMTGESFQVTLTDPLLDGWSVASLLTELLDTYRQLMQGVALPAPLPLASSYADFVALELEALASEECRGYWDEVLSGSSPQTLPRNKSGEPPQAQMIHRVQVAVPEVVSGKLRGVAHESRVWLKSVFLAAQVKLLGILTSRSDVIAGLISNGRPVREDGDKVIGTHLNALPLRIHLASCTWRELARKTFAAEREMMPYRWYPIAEIQRQRGRQPLFETVFNYTHFHVYRHIQDLTGIRIENGYASEQTYYPLTTQCQVNHLTGEVLLALDYTREMPAGQVESFAGYLLRILTAMAETPDRAHLEFSPLTPAEKHELLVERNCTRHEFNDCRSIVERVTAQAAANPEAPGVVWDGGKMSYGELNSKANQLAHYLIACNAGPEQLVAVCVDRSAEMLIGILATLKAGAAYVPIDPAYPDERIAAIARIVDARVFLTQERHARRLPPDIESVFCMDSQWRALRHYSESDPVATVDVDNTAYVIFTSGTTGTPKGVAIPHRCLLNLVDWHMATYGLNAQTRMSQLAGFGFDASVWEIWPVLSSGGSLHLADNATRLSPDELQAWLVANGITISFIPTSIFEAMLDLSWPPGSALRTVLIGGDRLRRYPGKTLPFALVNHYGPTENTVVATFGVVPVAPERADSPLIGRPMANTQAYILDTNLQPVPHGVPGQLYLGGSSLARGYFASPELTAEKFIPDGFSQTPGGRLYATGDWVAYSSDGNIQFLGRMDSQVKVRGVRIEIGEIEALLSLHPQVRESAVVALRDARGDLVLAAYVTPRSRTLQAEHIQAFLRTKLPEFMVPASVTLLESMPLTRHGKIDRNALLAPELPLVAEIEEFQPPRDEMERCVAKVWESVLQRWPVGIGQNFFSLGGHSLLATQVISRLRRALGLEISMAMLFEAPTVDRLAEKIREFQMLQANEAEIASLLDQIEQLSAEEVRACLEARPAE